LSISLTCDQKWGNQISPNPQVPPQTHVVQSRINSSYYATANGYEIYSAKTVINNYPQLTRSSFEKVRIKDIKDLALIVQLTSCSSFNSVGIVSIQILAKENSFNLVFTGQAKIEDPYLQGHLHKYGDFTRCKESMGDLVSLRGLDSGNVLIR